jgi:hypothetical protein
MINLNRKEKIHCTNCEMSYLVYLDGLQCRFFEKSYVWFFKGNSCARRNTNLDCKHFVDKRKEDEKK